MKKIMFSSAVALGIMLFAATYTASAQGRRSEAPGFSKERPGRNNEAPGHNFRRPGDRPGRGHDRGATGVPIDGGAGILLAAGAAYGLKKMRDYRRKREHEAGENII